MRAYEKAHALSLYTHCLASQLQITEQHIASHYITHHKYNISHHITSHNITHHTYNHNTSHIIHHRLHSYRKLGCAPLHKLLRQIMHIGGWAVLAETLLDVFHHPVWSRMQPSNHLRGVGHEALLPGVGKVIAKTVQAVEMDHSKRMVNEPKLHSIRFPLKLAHGEWGGWVRQPGHAREKEHI